MAMSALVEMLQEKPLAVAFGVIGLLCQLTWPLFRSRTTILLMQFGIGADYSVHYALLDAWSGAGVTSLGATQSALALAAGERPWLRRAGLVFLPVVAVLCVATWSGLASFCALAAVTLIMVGRMQRDTLYLRILLLAAAPFGMGYDMLVGSAPGLIGGIVSAAVAIATLAREISQRRGAGSRSSVAHHQT